MTKLPRISGRECVTALSKAGFQIKRQHGSHIILRRDVPFAQVAVPDHKEAQSYSEDVFALLVFGITQRIVAALAATFASKASGNGG
jgi:predicted RNA binding protein YcfA (HicA-like mRNA interferase family)